MATTPQKLLLTGLGLPNITLEQFIVLSNPMTLGTAGDSRNVWPSTSGVTNSKQSNQIATWLEFFSQGRFKLSQAHAFAVGGTQVSDLPGQVASLLAVTPRCAAALIETGTNTFNGGGTASAAWAIYGPCIAQLANARITPVVVLDLPRQQSTFSPGASAALESCRFNQLIRQNAPALGAIVVDLTALFVDAASATGDPLSVNYGDGIHLNPRGAFLAGQFIANYFTAFGKPAGGFASQRDTYDAAHNPSGSLLTASMGLMQGAGGSNSGTGASGTVATGWKNHLNGGTGTSVASIEARTDGGPGNWQRLDVASTGANAMDVRLELASQITTNFAAGDQVYLEADIQILNGVNVNAARSGLVAYASGFVKVSEGNYTALTSSPVEVLPDGTYAGKLTTPPVTIDGTVVNLTPTFFFGTTAAGGSLAARVGAVVPRKVI
ncbi:SGNH/GDSL hydrolase family protein [Bradyrhizobium sp. 4]|uniref:SGNH/GDSL hydrolase family protein n=1 Tax=unclassified Bradyrhizobium TaxID=2631580 RepID=UPI001FFC21BB|nr:MULTISPECIES: SGNH/GDSL hydrolase family protein [unclassified Bradyrhizobium]MCK1402041.1 SGNH/GDSL hydrolase family protein [Bradyrhizobium sp. 39]MCK1751239.1 SGNH/GDSL hydrolase family protein [Bradyrhizobium sp. 135]UPJ38493.1 SGNH/GDSL hydrolase family protein [Bradyrhizobium sp. 4]